MNTFYTYEGYLASDIKPVITIEEAHDIYEMLTGQLDENDEISQELWEDLLDKCFRYAAIRMQWSLYTREEKMEKDSLRTAVHDSLIISFNVIGRYHKKTGKDDSWREKLGDNRKRVGDFGCYIAYIHAINNR